MAREKLRSSKVVRLFLAALLTLGLAPASALGQLPEARAAGSAYMSEVLGVSRQQFIDHLNGNSGAYLGTAYKPDWPYPTAYETGPWWSRGNHPYEGHEWNGADGYGMNCSGFIARAWCDMGLENNGMVQAWKGAHQWMWANSETLRDTLIGHGVKYYAYNSKADMLAAGVLEKGDIIQMDSSSGTDDHVGIFWGDSPSDDKMWHSIFYRDSSTAGENMISEIYGKMTSGVYYVFKFDEGGWIDLDKDSSNPALTDGNACYDLAGATYGIYASQGDANSRTNALATLACDGAGYAKSGKLPVGAYYVRETTPGKGYSLDETIYAVNVSSGQTSRVNGGKVHDAPQNDPAVMWVGKIDLETTLNMPQGSASLAGAEFTVRYYDGFHATVADAEASGAPTRTWVVKTNENGMALLNDGYKVSGDEFYRDLDGSVTIPLGTLLIQESKAPAGYILDDATVYVRQVTSQGINESVETYNAPTQPEQVVRGGVEVRKIDRDSLLGAPMGSATLAGAQFAIRNVSNGSVTVNGVEVASGQDAPITLTTNEQGVASTAADALPYGDYELREVKAPTGYLLSDEVWAFSVRDNGVVVTPTLEQAIDNQVKRGDVEFTKKDGTSSTRMAGVPFLIVSETTGEAHVVVTDANGYVTTSSSYNAHTASTNANDAAWDGQAVDEALLNAYAGVWFGLGGDGAMAEANDGVGALPYDTYTIEELPCSANAGLQLVKQTGIVVSRDAFVIDLGTIDDPQASISTTARDGADGDKIVAADNEAIIIDRVSYWGLIPNQTYTIEGTLMDKATGKPFAPDGKELTAKATFTPATTSGYVEVEFAFNADGMDKTELVCFEKLFDANGRLIASHEDLGDADQTVTIVPPEIATTARDGADSDKEVSADPEAVIVDTVEYKNLVPGKTYTLSGTLMVKDTGEPVEDTEGNPVATSVEFAPEAADGEVEVTFIFDATALGGSDVVVFESLVRDGVEIAAHADIDDAGQTVAIVQPEIGTTARDGADGDKEVSADPEAELRDMVEYHNLVPGKTYTLSGTLMVKATGEPVEDAEGNPVTATTEFTPDLPHGYAEVAFTFDATALGGSDVVVFESLVREGVEVAAHADIDDAGQTVAIVQPEIATTLVDGVDGDKNVVADAQVTLTDTIEYKNLVPGKPYAVNGTLMVKDTGEPLTDAEGNPVTATGEFTPNHATGTVEVTFSFDGSLLAGKELVAFESLVREGVEVAVHADIDDVGQTVQITPSAIGTSAADGADGDKTVVADAEATIIDTVTYGNVLADSTYSLAGILMDKATGLPLVTGDADEDAVRAVFEQMCAAAGFGRFADDGHGNQAYRSSEQASDANKDDEASKDAEDKDASAEVEKDLADTDGILPLTPDYEALAEIFAANADIVEQMVIASDEFTPEHATGTLDMEFSFDASRWIQAEQTSDVVVFELLLKDDAIIAAHADLEDENQTVTITPSEIATTATDKTDGDHDLIASATATVIDTVEYKNLIPGKEYKLDGVLYDKGTNKPLLVGDKKVEASAVFTPNAPDGTVELEFAFDATGLSGRSLVAFEYLSKDGVEVAVHADINDENQTVRIVEAPIGSTYDKTGNAVKGTLALLSAIALAGVGAAAYGIRQRKIAVRSEASGAEKSGEEADA